MSEENKKTLKVYDKYAKLYLSQSKSHAASDTKKAEKKKSWIKDFILKGFSELGQGARILEIGSADGENSKMMEEMNFDVTASDVAEDFLSCLKSKTLKFIKFNLLTDDFDRNYDGIFLWRVFVHFTKEDFRFALGKIFDDLMPGGKVIFNVLNSESDENINKGWFDFPGEYHLGSERYFQQYEENELRKIIKDAGFDIEAFCKNGGSKENKWFCIILKKPLKVKKKILEYVESEIIPKYDSGAGHSSDHIQYVIRRSMKFAEGILDINLDMVYVIASYHDIGRMVDNENHEIESAKIFLKDVEMRNFFSDEERKIISEAIEDHRASLKRDPRSVYGKIVSSADRNTSAIQMMKRLYEYTKSLMPDIKDDDIVETAREVLRKKYGLNGYATKKMYFKDPDFESCIAEIDQITENPKEFEKIVLRYK